MHLARRLCRGTSSARPPRRPRCGSPSCVALAQSCAISLDAEDVLEAKAVEGLEDRESLAAQAAKQFLPFSRRPVVPFGPDLGADEEGPEVALAQEGQGLLHGGI